MSWLQRFNNLCSFSSLLIATLIFLQCICNGAAIRCFVCDSSVNPSCADLKSNSTMVAEECSLEKTKSLNTWLFELNKFSYFDTGTNKDPLMNCQKVVAKDPTNNKMVTARFCQLDTADSNSCSILRTKLKINADGTYSQNNNNGRRGKHGSNGKAEEQQQFHCSICNTDSCNGSTVKTLTGSAFSVILLLIMQQLSVW
ncbi:uncharacterized protein LOC119662454 [Teleopsis dalmanni]|uniref:uncharacterized protein LOC119662454 n=1 Tax=Teleopsis dalmanni TaxID=139649 RepID=UPI0018CE4149|nr:uncharacterized protein LOC119662454 [Teleopsis dalmanni]